MVSKLYSTQFPLSVKDGKPVVRLSASQRKWIDKLNKAIDEGILQLHPNDCLCGNPHRENDIVVAEKDRYGLPISQILCCNCGLIRSGVTFDEESNAEFYKTYYRPIYSSEKPTDDFFNQQIKTGHQFIKFIKQNIPFDNIDHLAEIGCGAGGILMPFKAEGKRVDGYDYGQEYLKYGIAKGLNLHCGGYEQIEDASLDLIILSHVMEHFLDPIDEMTQIVKKIKAGKYLLVEVPGVFWISEGYFNPIWYFQNAHVFNYYSDYLSVFFKSLGLKVLYGDERCTFICQKPVNWKLDDVKPIVWDSSLQAHQQKIISYLVSCDRRYKNRFSNPVWLKHCLWLFANKVGWQRIRPYFIKNKS
ncbi:MAG: class I SAM-dependent methyltransferase [Paludibacteraceae bacterium]|nr:class I SAM-dependent methyltransferase [Paludibacteraceae bacterium]